MPPQNSETYPDFCCKVDKVVIPRYTPVMKTAISLPDDLFTLADQFAKNLGMSRSEFYAKALRAYIAAQQNSNLTDQINEACAELNTALPADFANVTRRKLLELEW